MPTDVLKVSGDYLLDAGNGNITLNVTNTATTGTVTILGNLNVIGTSTNIASVNSLITDNVIVINSGETAAPGITLDTAGILISRGLNNSPTAAASILYNESIASGYWTDDIGRTRKGIFEFKVATTGSAIRVNAIRIDASTSTLSILGADAPYSMINVKGQINYDQRVIDDNDIPNKKYVDQTLIAGTTSTRRIAANGTILKVQDNTIRPTSDPAYNPVDTITGTLGTESNVVLQLAGTQALIQGITFTAGNRISTTTATDLTLHTANGFAVEISEAIKLDKSSTGTWAAITDVNTIYYTGIQGGGGTGLYYVNKQNDITNSDELVSRRRAIIYGIIF